PRKENPDRRYHAAARARNDNEDADSRGHVAHQPAAGGADRSRACTDRRGPCGIAEDREGCARVRRRVTSAARLRLRLRSGDASTTHKDQIEGLAEGKAHYLGLAL